MRRPVVYPCLRRVYRCTTVAQCGVSHCVVVHEPCRAKWGGALRGLIARMDSTYHADADEACAVALLAHYDGGFPVRPFHGRRAQSGMAAAYLALVAAYCADPTMDLSTVWALPLGPDERRHEHCSNALDVVFEQLLHSSYGECAPWTTGNATWRVASILACTPAARAISALLQCRSAPPRFPADDHDNVHYKNLARIIESGDGSGLTREQVGPLAFLVDEGVFVHLVSAAIRRDPYGITWALTSQRFVYPVRPEAMLNLIAEKFRNARQVEHSRFLVRTRLYEMLTSGRTFMDTGPDTGAHLVCIKICTFLDRIAGLDAEHGCVFTGSVYFSLLVLRTAASISSLWMLPRMIVSRWAANGYQFAWDPFAYLSVEDVAAAFAAIGLICTDLPEPSETRFRCRNIVVDYARNTGPIRRANEMHSERCRGAMLFLRGVHLASKDELRVATLACEHHHRQYVAMERDDPGRRAASDRVLRAIVDVPQDAFSDQTLGLIAEYMGTDTRPFRIFADPVSVDDDSGGNGQQPSKKRRN